MKKVIILFVAVISFYCIPDAFALDSIYITDCKECTTFSDIKAKYNSLKSSIESGRSDSEDMEAYENRIKKCKEDLSSFLDTVYEGQFDLDSARIDWGSNTLITSRELPVEYMWGDDLYKDLTLSIVLTHLRLREMITFKKHISYVITFKLDENCAMQFINVKAVYRGEEILYETSLSSL